MTAIANAVALALAFAGGLHQAVLASVPLNDDFVHFVLARQLLAGEWPVRDFFDSGLGLMYGLSALAQTVFGYRLLAEAAVVGAATAVSTYLVFRLVRQLTASTLAASLAAVLIVVAGPRGYSYPKVLVYAVAASLWWGYQWHPGAVRAAALGAWTAAAFYWRPDHGVYVAAGTVLAMITAHGFRTAALARSIQAGAVALALVLPFLVFVSFTLGLWSYVQSGVTFARAQHRSMDTHAWPYWPIRTLADVVRYEPGAAFAPVITLRWAASSSEDARRAILARYDLTPLGDVDGSSQPVKLGPGSFRAIRALLNEPIVEDTAGVDRATASLPAATWSLWDRLRFQHPWLRLRLFAGIDEQTRAAEASAFVLYALPVLALVWALLPVPRRGQSGAVTRRRLAGFAVFAALVTAALLRTPYSVRAAEGVVLPSILFGCVIAASFAAVRTSRLVPRVVLAVACVGLSVLTVKSVAVAGEFGGHVNWLTGEWRSIDRMRGAWAEVRDRLIAEPPIRFWDARPAPVSVRLASYVRECLPASERLLVLWLAPEIYYYADRLMAARHLVFVPGYQTLDHEQRLALAKIERYAPPIALANSSLDANTREIFPRVVAHVHRAYQLAASFEEDGERYLVLARRDREPVRHYGERRWPCYL